MSHVIGFEVQPRTPSCGCLEIAVLKAENEPADRTILTFECHGLNGTQFANVSRLHSNVIGVAIHV
jgi:hypothetical protein